MSNKYYSNPIDSYTSHSEFDWDKRVQITNEVPPIDIYGMVHHLIKDDIWKWFFGNIDINLNIEYNVNTDGEEVFDKDGEIVEGSIAKYVNGVRAKDYGPRPVTENTIFKVPSFNRIEIYGSFLPESDLMLHEGYRYLDTLYPDHEDYVQILTNHEIDDNINQAAALIDYQLNISVMDYITEELKYKPHLVGADLQRAKDYENIKVKIRDLKANSFRRKFYGALQGYKMFGSEIFQHITVYPVAEYLSQVTYLNDDPYIDHNNEVKNWTWPRKFFKQPEDDDRTVENWNPLYRKQFRLIDWTNQSYDYTIPPPPVIYGTAHSIPISFDDIYEFKLDDNTIIPDTNINEDFVSGQSVLLDNHNANLNLIWLESAWDSLLRLNYSNNNHISEIIELKEKICHISVSHDSEPEYTEFKVYPGVYDLIQESFKKYYNLTEYDAVFTTGTRASFVDSIKKLIAAFPSMPKIFKNIKFVLSPFQKGEFYMHPPRTLSIYPDNVNYEIFRDSRYLNAYIEFYKDEVASHSLVKFGNLIATEEIKDVNEHLYIGEISDIRKGSMLFELKSTKEWFDDEVNQVIKPINDTKVAKHGIIYEDRLLEGTYYSGRAKIFMFGKANFKLSDYTEDSTRILTDLDFHITAIPRIKDHWMMKALYTGQIDENYDDLTSEKFDKLLHIFESYPIPSFVLREKTRNDQMNQKLSPLNTRLNSLKEMANTDALTPTSPIWIELYAVSGNAGLIIEYCNTYLIQSTVIMDTYKSEFIKLHWRTFRDFVNNPNNGIWNPSTQQYDHDLFNEQFDMIFEFFQRCNYEEGLINASKVTNDINRDFYRNLNITEPDLIKDRERIVYIDTVLDIYMRNQANLLDPIPDDIYMRSHDFDGLKYRVVEAGDVFKEFITCKLDWFECYIDYERSTDFGRGKTIDFDFGTVNACSLVEDNENIYDLMYIDPSTGVESPGKVLQDLYEHFSSTDPNQDYMVEYEAVDESSVTHKYITLNQDIVGLNTHLDSWIRKFGFVSYDFIEQFYVTRRNIQSVEVEYKTLKIRGIINVEDDPYRITFVDLESFARLYALSLGTQVIGGSIQPDTFINSIDLDNHTITVDRHLVRSGDFVLKFLIKYESFPIEINDGNFYDYRVDLFKKDILDTANPFNHGFYGSNEWPWPSNTFVNGVIDIKRFKEILLYNLKNNSAFRKYFNTQCWINYSNHTNKLSNYVLPSLINVRDRELFYELTAYKTYEEGKYLCRKELLDYFTDVIQTLSKANDDANVGFNITAETDSSGRHIFIEDQEYTDPHIRNKFATYKWDVNSVPIYAEIGTGYLEDFFNKALFPPDRDRIEDKSYWNYDIYDDARFTSDHEKYNNRHLPIISDEIPHIEVEISTVPDPAVSGAFFSVIRLITDMEIPAFPETFFVSAENDEFGDEYIISSQDGNVLTTSLIESHIVQPDGSIIKAPFSGVAIIRFYHKTYDNHDYYTPWQEHIEHNLKTDLKEIDRAVYFQKDFQVKPIDFPDWDHVDKPLFEVVLGEYEVHGHETFNGLITDRNKYTTIQFSIINKLFKDLKTEFLVQIQFPNFFKDEYIYQIRQGFFESENKNIDLIKPGFNDEYDQLRTNILNVSFLGLWKPAIKRMMDPDTGRQWDEIDWPVFNAIDSYMYYYVCSESNSFKNVYNPMTGITHESFEFNKGYLICYKYNLTTLEGKWSYKNYVWGGLYGASIMIPNFLEYNPTEYEESLIINNSFSPGYMSFDHQLPDDGLNSTIGNYTIIDRLLLKTLIQTGMFQGDQTILLSYSYREKTEIWDWILNRVSDMNVAGYSLREYGVEYNTVQDLLYARLNYTSPSEFLRKTSILKGSFDYYEVNGVEQENELDSLPGVNKDSLIYFFYTGFANDVHVQFKFLLGTVFCLYYDYSSPVKEFKIVEIEQNSKNIFNILFQPLPKFSVIERSIYFGNYGTFIKQILPISKVNHFINNIEMPHQFDNLKCEVLLSPKNIHTGYKYEDYVLIHERSPLTDFIIDEYPIFYDQEHNIFYTYNIDENDRRVFNKFVIRFNENRFFKNTINMICKYQNVYDTSEGVKLIHKITQSPDIPFPIDDLTIEDRILEIEEISLRSNYSSALESTLYSSYANLTGTLRGIQIDGNDRYLLYSYKEMKDILQVPEKIKFLQEVNKIIPVYEQPNGSFIDYTSSYVNFDVDNKFPDGISIQTPVISQSTVYNLMTDAGANDSFTYYKNTLILEGIMNTNLMNTIDFSKNNVLQDAFKYSLPGDRVLKIVGLSPSKLNIVQANQFQNHQPPVPSDQMPSDPTDFENIIQFPLSTEILSIADFDFKNGYFVTASDDGIVTVHKLITIERLPVKIDTYTYSIRYLIADDFTTESKLTGLSFYDKDKKWILSYSTSKNASFFIEFTAETGFARVIDDHEGKQIDTYQVLEILDIDARSDTTISPPSTGNQYAKIFARDMSYIKAKTVQQVITNLNRMTDWTGGNITDTTDAKSNLGIAIANSGSSTVSTSKIIPIDPLEYVELSFSALQVSGDGTLGLSVLDDQVYGVFHYNRSTMNWDKLYNPPIDPLNPYLSETPIPKILTDFRNKIETQFKTYLVGYDYFDFTGESRLDLNTDRTNELIPLPPPAPPGMPVPRWKGEPLFEPTSYVMGILSESNDPFDPNRFLINSQRLVYKSSIVTGLTERVDIIVTEQEYDSRTGWTQDDIDANPSDRKRFVLMKDYNQPLSMIYPPSRVPYGSSNLYYGKTVLHSQDSNGSNGTFYGYSDIRREQELPNDHKITIADAALACGLVIGSEPNNGWDGDQMIIEVPSITPEKEKFIVETTTASGKIINSVYIQNHGYHLEVARNADGTPKTDTCLIIVLESFYTYPTLNYTFKKTVKTVTLFELKENIPGQGDPDWLKAEIKNPKIVFKPPEPEQPQEVGVSYAKMKTGANQYSDIDNSYQFVKDGMIELNDQNLIATPKQIGFAFQGDGDSSTWTTFNRPPPSETEATQEITQVNTVISVSNMYYMGVKNTFANSPNQSGVTQWWSNFIPYKEFFKNLPLDEMGLFTDSPAPYMDTKWFIDESKIGPKTTEGVGREWPLFEVPIDQMDKYQNSRNWVRDVYIYTDDYTDYVSKYISYINSDAFKRYIKILQDYWGYRGGQNFDVLIKRPPGTEGMDPFTQNWDELAFDSGSLMSLVTYPLDNPAYHGFNKYPPFELGPEWLNRLPPPESTNNVDITAIIFKKDVINANLKFTTSSNNGSYQIYNMKTSSIPKIDISTSIFDQIEEGCYNPYKSNEFIENLKEKIQSAKYTASNKNNYLVKVYGDKLFVWSPTKTVGPDGYDGNLTQAYHWKVARLPQRRRNEFEIFDDMNFQEVYQYVFNAYTSLKNSLDDLINSPSSKIGGTVNSDRDTVALKMYQQWLIKNEPIKFESEQEIPPMIMMYNITFEQSADGKIPTFSYIESPQNVLNAPKTVYQSVMSEEYQYGNIVTVQLKKENYINYLIDYNTYILGEKRFENFFDYLNAYYIKDKIKFGNKWNNLIKEINLSNDALTIITNIDDVLILDTHNMHCREDIENYNNWTVNQIDKQYVTHRTEDKNYNMVTMRTLIDPNLPTDIQSYVINQFPYSSTIKNITFNARMYDNNNVILAGYVQASKEVYDLTINQETYSIYNDLYPNDGWKYFGDWNETTGTLDNAKKYPVIYFSNNNGKSFTKCIITPQESIPDIRMYNSVIVNADGSIIPRHVLDHIECLSIHKHGSEYHIWYINPDKDLISSEDEALKELMIPKSEPGKSNAEEAYSKYLPLGFTSISIDEFNLKYKDDFNIIDDFELDRTELCKVIDNSILSVVDSNRIIKQSPYALDLSDLKVTGIDEDRITINNDQYLGTDEDLRVLVSILPSSSLIYQTKYLESNQDYIDNEGYFVVPTIYKVGSSLTANRVFSYRETLRPSERPNVPVNSIPSVLEDVNMRIYQYDGPVLYPNGEEKYEPHVMTNSEGHIIKLCDEKGNYLIKRDSESILNNYRLWSILSNSINIDYLANAIVLRPDIDLRIKDLEFTDFINNDMKSKVEVQHFDLDPNNPFIRISSVWMEKLVKFMAGERTGLTVPYIQGTDRRFYEWPIDQLTGEPDMDPEIYFKLPDGSDDYDSPTEFGKAILYLENIYGPFDSTYNPIRWQDRLEPYKIILVDSSIHYYIFDKMYNYIMTNSNYVLESSISIPYKFKAGHQEFLNEDFIFDKTEDDFEYIVSPDTLYPITNVFLNPKGYGGNNINESFKLRNPYDLDYIAWKEEISRNDRGEIVYLSDDRNNRLESNHGLFELFDYETTEISYDTLTDYYRNDFNVYIDYPKDPNLYNIYKLPESKYDIFTVESTIYFDCHYSVKGQFNLGTDDEIDWMNPSNPLSNDYWTPFNFGDTAYASMLSICYIRKNGILQEIDHTWQIKFTDENDKPVYTTNAQLEPIDISDKFRFYDNKIFYVYDQWDTDWRSTTPDRHDGDGRDDATRAAAFFDRVPSVIGGKLKVTFIDRNRVKISKVFDIAPSLQRQYLKPIQTNFIEFGNESLDVLQRHGDDIVMNYNIINMYFDGWTLPTGNKTIQSLDENTKPQSVDIVIVYADPIDPLNQETLYPVTFLYKLTLQSRPFIENVYSDINGKNIYLRLSMSVIKDINMYLNRNWFIILNDINHIQKKIYAQDIDITDLFRFEIKSDEESYWISASNNSLAITQHLEKVINNNFIYLDNFKFVYSKYDLPFTLSITGYGDSVICSGIYGNVMFLRPEYTNFKELIDEKGKDIHYKKRKILAVRNSSDINLFDVVDNINYFALLSKPLYDDFEQHNLKIRVLPVQSVLVDIKKMNNPEYITEVSTREIEQFGFDRVWNNELFTQPPIIINGTVYNESSLYNYSLNDNYVNKDQFKVYVSDEKGRYIKIGKDQNGLVHSVLGDETGNLSQDIYADIDPRYNSYQPYSITAQDLYKAQFYSPHEQSNPFWQYLVIEKDNQDVYEDILMNGSYRKTLVPKDKVYFEFFDPITYEVNSSGDGLLIGAGNIMTKKDLRFILRYPSEMYKSNLYISKYGISVINNFYIGRIHTKVWTAGTEVLSKIKASYVTNVLNPVNDKNPDNRVPKITEIGLFDSKHKMIAYMSHPIVEYRTDTQHISYTLLVRNAPIPMIQMEDPELDGPW